MLLLSMPGTFEVQENFPTIIIRSLQQMSALSIQERPRRLARPRTPPFHGDNTGSNPVGDAKSYMKELQYSAGKTWV